MGSLLVAWRESDDQPQCGGDVHAFHHERGGGAAAMPCEHDGQAGDEGDHRDGEFDAAARVVRLPRLKLEIMVSHQKVSGSSMVNLLSGKASGESVAQTLSQSVYVSPSFQKPLIAAFP